MAKATESSFFPVTNRLGFQRLIESEKIGIFKHWGQCSGVNGPSGGVTENLLLEHSSICIDISTGVVLGLLCISACAHVLKCLPGCGDRFETSVTVILKWVL